jgi:hypothetical protein
LPNPPWFRKEAGKGGGSRSVREVGGWRSRVARAASRRDASNVSRLDKMEDAVGGGGCGSTSARGEEGFILDFFRHLE